MVRSHPAHGAGRFCAFPGCLGLCTLELIVLPQQGKPFPLCLHLGLLPAQTHAAHPSCTGHSPASCHSSIIVGGADNASPRADVAGRDMTPSLAVVARRDITSSHTAVGSRDRTRDRAGRLQRPTLLRSPLPRERPKSIPDVTPPAVMMFPSLTTRAGSFAASAGALVRRFGASAAWRISTKVWLCKPHVATISQPSRPSSFSCASRSLRRLSNIRESNT